MTPVSQITATRSAEDGTPRFALADWVNLDYTQAAVLLAEAGVPEDRIDPLLDEAAVTGSATVELEA